jgi:hypothetical protein
MISLGRFCRRLICRPPPVARWGSVIAYAVLALGIPLPIPAGPASDQPYPCMHHRCGCVSPEQCWRNCCCMSLEEKLAWARDNHVTPPHYVLAEARLHGILWEEFCAQTPDETASTCPCCANHSHRCCGTVGCEMLCRSSPSMHDCAKRSGPNRGVILIEALKCHGAGDNWHGLSVSLPPPSEVCPALSDDVIQWISLPSETHLSLSFPPALPPPRSAA